MSSRSAPTLVELKEKKHRIEDAVSATRAAIEEGIVAGGGSALVHAVSVPRRQPWTSKAMRQTGVGIVRRAAVEPLRWIAENAGEPGQVIVAKVRELGVGNGYNAATGEYGDLVAQGVIDPVKVTSVGVEHAASIAGCCSRPKRSSSKSLKRMKTTITATATARRAFAQPLHGGHGQPPVDGQPVLTSRAARCPLIHIGTGVCVSRCSR